MESQEGHLVSVSVYKVKTEKKKKKECLKKGCVGNLGNQNFYTSYKMSDGRMSMD